MSVVFYIRASVIKIYVFMSLIFNILVLCNYKFFHYNRRDSGEILSNLFPSESAAWRTVKRAKVILFFNLHFNVTLLEIVWYVRSNEFQSFESGNYQCALHWSDFFQSRSYVKSVLFRGNALLDIRKLSFHEFCVRVSRPISFCKILS